MAAQAAIYGKLSTRDDEAWLCRCSGERLCVHTLAETCRGWPPARPWRDEGEAACATSPCSRRAASGAS